MRWSIGWLTIRPASTWRSRTRFWEGTTEQDKVIKMWRRTQNPGYCSCVKKYNNHCYFLSGMPLVDITVEQIFGDGLVWAGVVMMALLGQQRRWSCQTFSKYQETGLSASTSATTFSEFRGLTGWMRTSRGSSWSRWWTESRGSRLSTIRLVFLILEIQDKDIDKDRVKKIQALDNWNSSRILFTSKRVWFYISFIHFQIFSTVNKSIRKS